MIHKTDKTTYYIEEYSIETHSYDKDITLNSGTINLSMDTVEDALQVAKLAHITNFVILQSNVDGSWGDHNKRVAVRGKVEEWEATIKKQDNRDETNKLSTIKALNALPDKVTLYKDKEFNITATKDQTAPDKWRWSDVKYSSMQVLFRKEELSRSWGGFITRSGQVLKKDFAKKVYEQLHYEKLRKMNYTEEKEFLANLAPEFVKKYAVIIEAAVKELNRHNKIIDNIKAKNGAD